VKTLIAVVVSLFLCAGRAWATGLTVTTLKGESGTNYHIYGKNDLDIAWHIKRPDGKNGKIKLCIPAAFTTTTGTVVGVYAVNGKVGNANRISKPIGGAIKIEDGKFKIFPSGNGARFTPDFLRSLETKKASLFQQFQIVESGTPAKFKDKKSFQMRCIAKFTDGREGVVESDTDITFKTFNADLAAMGVQDAIYTDMGAWDEGWIRDSKTGSLTAIGNDRSLTHKQTNWVTFSER